MSTSQAQTSLTKCCNGCSKIKTLECFYRCNKNFKDGREAKCKACRDAQRKYRLRHRAKQGTGVTTLEVSLMRTYILHDKPSHVEISKMFNMHIASVWSRFNAMVRKGLLIKTKKHKTHCSYEVTELGQEYLDGKKEAIHKNYQTVSFRNHELANKAWK